MTQDHGTYVVPVFGQPEADGVDIDAVHTKAPWYADALTQRILAFYERNPDEWLTYWDMALKFKCSVSQATQACAWLKRSGAAVKLTNDAPDGYMVQLKPIVREAT